MPFWITGPMDAGAFLSTLADVVGIVGFFIMVS
jgi:hypothetical protein